MKNQMFSVAVCLIILGVPALAQEKDQVAIDLTGLRLKDKTNQFRSSDPDRLRAGWAYAYEIAGKVKGESGVMKFVYPDPIDLAVLLEEFAPGSSDFLEGEIYNASGDHPFEIFGERFEGEGEFGGIDVTFGVTISGGIDDQGHTWFSLTDVIISPAFLVGNMIFTSGQVTITRIPAESGDANWDGSVDLLDVSPFITALLDDAEYERKYGHSVLYACDANRDGSVDTLDVEPFIALLLG